VGEGVQKREHAVCWDREIPPTREMTPTSLIVVLRLADVTPVKRFLQPRGFWAGVRFSRPHTVCASQEGNDY